MTISGQITLTTQNTKYDGTDLKGSAFLIKAHPDNAGVVYVGNVSDTVTVNNGYPLSANEYIYIEVSNLNHLKFISATASQKVCWIRVEV
jgi:hypothetical protein